MNKRKAVKQKKNKPNEQRNVSNLTYVSFFENIDFSQ